MELKPNKENIIIIVSLTALVLFTVFLFISPTTIISSLENIKSYAEDNPLVSGLLMGSMIILTCFPPMIGYSLMMTFSSYCFGFLYGFVIAYTFSIVGASLCFLIGRFLFANNKLSIKHSKITHIYKAIESRGLKVLILIRLAPYPCALLNLLFHFSWINLIRY